MNKCWVLSLPTRDGNSPPPTQSSSQTYTGFKPTYKGWKQKVIQQRPLCRHVLSLPTRDGNTPGSRARLTPANRFKPTYKGWKPVHYKGNVIDDAGFKPTYKGWKPVHYKGNVIDDAGFKPTYKGWKQDAANNGQWDELEF